MRESRWLGKNIAAAGLGLSTALGGSPSVEAGKPPVIEAPDARLSALRETLCHGLLDTGSYLRLAKDKGKDAVDHKLGVLWVIIQELINVTDEVNELEFSLAMGQLTDPNKREETLEKIRRGWFEPSIKGSEYPKIATEIVEQIMINLRGALDQGQLDGIKLQGLRGQLEQAQKAIDHIGAAVWKP